MTKGLTDTSLTTVAAIAAAILAAVINVKLRGLAFTVLLIAYAAYVYLQAIYRLLNTAYGVALLRRETEARLQDAVNQIGEQPVRVAAQTLPHRWAQFRRCSAATALAYLAITALIVLLAIAGLQTNALRAPISTATPTTTPQPTVRLSTQS